METLLVEGRLKKRQAANRRPEECRVFIADHHVGYIDWATYEENQRMTRRNPFIGKLTNRRRRSERARACWWTVALWPLWPQAACALLGWNWN